MIKIIKSDFEGFDDWTHIVEPTRFPDGTSQLWKLPEFCFYEMFTHIIWDFESELEIIPFLQTVQLLNKKSRVDMITIPFMPYSRQDKEVAKVNAEQTRIRVPFAAIDRGCVFKEEKHGILIALEYPSMKIYEQENID